MKIATRLKLAGLFSAAVAVAIGAVLLLATQQVKQEIVKNTAAGEVLRGGHCPPIPHAGIRTAP